MTFYTELTENQRRIFIDAEQVFDAYLEALEEAARYNGSMRWKRSGDKEYLFRGSGRKGYGRSLGRRSAETEVMLKKFSEGKTAAKDRLTIVKKQLAEQARFCKAASIQRLPLIVSRILRVLKQSLLLGSNVVVSGTYCLYAYEAAAGVRINSDVVATRDIDLLWDSRSRLRLVSTQKLEGMLGLLQKVDQSFLRSKQMYRAVNSEGFMVDLIKPVPNPPSRVESVAMGGDADLQAAELFSQRWMVSAPKMKQLVIGMDGVPVCMVVPDPRVFALHKLWLSEQTEREPMKKRRDRAQALLVAELVVRYLPQFQFQENELRMFPRSVLKMLDELPPCFT